MNIDCDRRLWDVFPIHSNMTVGSIYLKTWTPKPTRYNDLWENAIWNLKIDKNTAHAAFQPPLHFFIRTISPITSLSVSIVWNYSMCPEISGKKANKKKYLRPCCLWHAPVASIFVRRNNEPLDHNRMLQRIKGHNDDPDSSGKWAKINAIRKRKCSSENAEWRKKSSFFISTNKHIIAF